MKLLYLLKPWGSVNPGETAGYKDNKADELITAGVGVLADPETRKPLVPLDQLPVALVDSDAGSGAGNKEPDGEYQFNELTDPFINDGLAKNTSMDLHKAGLHTPADVQAYLADGKSLKDIKGLTAAEIKKVTSLYSAPAA